EEIRLLSNLETKQHKLLQIVLFGQPELDDNLRKPEIRKLRERITHSFSLTPLKAEEVRAYIAFRLRAAGYHGPDLFNNAGIRYLASATGGLTRRVNIVADKALLAAFAENTHNVSLKHLRAAVQDSEFSNARRYRGRRSGLLPVFALGLVGAAGIGFLYYQYGGATGPNMRLPPSGTQIAPQPSPRAPAAVAKSEALDLAHSAPSPQPEFVAGPQAVPAKAAVGVSPEPLKMSATLSTHSDLLEQRLLATERWLDEADGAVFSIQLLGSNDPTLLTNYFEKLAKYIEIEKVFVYRTKAHHQPSMTVLYGAFGIRLHAVKSLEALPEELKANRPYIRTVQGIRVEIGTKKPS